MFMIGSMLYLAIIPLIFYRLTFVRLTSRDFSPPYWINMGAVAITTLAGATLMMRVGHWPVLDQISSFLPGFTLFFWAAATWWIPLLIALMIWRYVVRREVPARAWLWGMVFPLGMYTTATFQLSRATHLEFLARIPEFSSSSHCRLARRIRRSASAPLVEPRPGCPGPGCGTPTQLNCCLDIRIGPWR